MPVKKSKIYSIPLAVASTTLADTLTRYITHSGSAAASSANTYPIYPAFNGKIIGLYLMFVGTAATSENVAFYIDVSGTPTTLTTTADMSVMPFTLKYNNLNIPVTTADYISVKVVCPTWVTDPGALTIKGYFVLSCA